MPWPLSVTWKKRTCVASSLDTPFADAACAIVDCHSGQSEAYPVAKSPLFMAFTQAMAASPEPANWPLSPPDWSLPIEPPGFVGGGSAPPGRLMSVSMGIIGADE